MFLLYVVDRVDLLEKYPLVASSPKILALTPAVSPEISYGLQIIGNLIMHIIKEHLFGLKKQVKQQPHEEQGRVIVHDRLQVRGDIISSLPAKFGSEFFVALIQVPVKKVNTFTIGVGSLRITLKSNMSLKPNLDTLRKLNDQHDNTLSIIASDGKHVYLHFSSNDMFDRWHLALREALAEMVLTESFARIKDGSLSIRKIEMAVQKGQLLVNDDNLYMQKAKRLLEAKLSLKQVLARLTKNPQAASREEVELFLQSIGGDTLLQRDSQFQLLQELAPKLYSEKALDSLQAPIANNVSLFSLSTSASVNESITATLKQLKASPERPVTPLLHIKSPIRNRFHQALTEVTLHSTAGKKKLPRQEIKDFCNVLIDDAGAADADTWGEVFASPSATPLSVKRPVHLSNSHIKREKRRKNRVIKFQNVKFGSSSSSNSSAQSSAEKSKPMDQVGTEDTLDDVWVDADAEEVDIAEITENNASMEAHSTDAVVAVEETQNAQIEEVVEGVEEIPTVETQEAAVEADSPESDVVESEVLVEVALAEPTEELKEEEPSPIDGTATMEVQGVTTTTNSPLVIDIDAELEMLLLGSVSQPSATAIVEVPESMGVPAIEPSTTVITTGDPTFSVWDAQDAVFEENYRELFGEEPSPVPSVEILSTDSTVVALDSVGGTLAHEIQVDDATEVLEASVQQTQVVGSTEDVNELISDAVESTVEEISTSEVVVVADLSVAATASPIKTPVITPAKSDLTLNAFNALTKVTPSIQQMIKRVSPELVIRVRPRSRRVQNKAFKSRSAASAGIVVPSTIEPNENIPPPTAATPIATVPSAATPTLINSPLVLTQCSPLRSKLDPLPLSGTRSPFRDIGNNSNNSVVNMLLHNDDKSDRFRNLKGFPLLPSNSKAFNSITNSLAKIDTPIRVPDSHTTTSVFTMRPADSGNNAGVFAIPSTSTVGTPYVSTQPPAPQSSKTKQQSPAEALMNELTTKYKPSPTTAESLSKINISSFPEEDFKALLEALMAEPEDAIDAALSGATPMIESVDMATSPINQPELSEPDEDVINEKESPTLESKQNIIESSPVEDNGMSESIVSAHTIQTSQPSMPAASAKARVTTKTKEINKNKPILTLNKDFTVTVNDKPTVTHWKKNLWIYGLFFICLLPLLFLGSHLVKQGGVQTWSGVSPSFTAVSNPGKLSIDAVRRDYLQALQHYEEVGGYDAANPMTVSEVELRIIVSSPIKMSRLLQLSKRKLRTIVLNALKAVGKGVKNFFQKMVGFVTFKAIEM